MFTQKNFIPKFFSTAKAGLEAHEEKLLEFIGKTISNIYVVWDEEDDEWFCDAPVVVEIDNIFQLELLADRLDNYSISFNELDLSLKPTWFSAGGDDDDEFRLAWRANCLPELKTVVGETIESFSFEEYRFVTTGLFDKKHSENVDNISKSGWLMNALAINTDRGLLSVFNALDQNGLSNHLEAGENYRRFIIRK